MRLIKFAALAAALAGGPALAQGSGDAVMQSLIRKLSRGGGLDHNLDRGLRLPREATAGAPVAESPAPAPVARQPVVLATNAAARPVVPPTPRETTSALPSASITVTFARASAALTAQARAELAPLGRALRSAELAGDRFRLEGHTDSEGDPAINQTLSAQRAASVRDYLIREFRVPAERLEAVGYGDKQLLVPTPPNTPELRNRRVQVVNVGS